MENHGLETHSDSIVTGKHPKCPTILPAHLPKTANYLGYF